MSYKTILVCLTTPTNAERLTKFASNLARQFDAHLVGLHTLQALNVYPGIGIPAADNFAADFQKAQQSEADKIKKTFESFTENEDFVSEWRCVEANSDSAADRLVEHARCADLIVMAQPDEENDRPDKTTVQREVIEKSGRPVLVLPKYGEFEKIGTNTLVGWSATKEATRAVHDAIPIMANSKSANIFWVSKSKSKDTYLAHSAREIAAVLDRNHVKANVCNRPYTGLPIGDEILNEAADTGADLIVSGAYGHSRMYDFMIGATTPHLMKHMTVPILFSC